MSTSQQTLAEGELRELAEKLDRLASQCRSDGYNSRALALREAAKQADRRAHKLPNGTYSASFASEENDDDDRGHLVAFDFDKTLTDGDVEYWNDEIPDPDEDMCTVARETYRRGYHVVIWTARPWRAANKVAARLAEWRVPYHGIRCEKGAADLYVDDKAIAENDVSSVDDIEAMFDD